jgi:signal transduction histidine kinase
LRTPMASIYGFTELLLTRDDIQPAKQKDLLNRIYRQCEGMITIINELLDLARIESRRGKDFHREQIDLAQLVQQVVNDFQVPLDRHPPIIDDHAMPTRVWGDIRKTRQAILNVLSNAYKYSPDGGDICIDYAQSSGRRIGVRISDVGVGMTPEQLARLGERFFRADKSGKIPGTGLGISIVREIMTLMGGELEVQSEKGQGTSVTLWLAVD